MKIQLQDGESYDVFSCIATREKCVSELNGDSNEQWVFWQDPNVAIHIDTLKTINSVHDKVTFTWSYGDDDVDLRALNIKCNSAEEANDVIETIASVALHMNTSNTSCNK